jgi:hypothetical protein
MFGSLQFRKPTGERGRHVSHYFEVPIAVVTHHVSTNGSEAIFEFSTCVHDFLSDLSSFLNQSKLVRVAPSRGGDGDESAGPDPSAASARDDHEIGANPVGRKLSIHYHLLSYKEKNSSASDAVDSAGLTKNFAPKFLSSVV